MNLRIFDVEHGACAMAIGPSNALAMIDCGDNVTSGWRPSDFIRNKLNRSQVDYLLITNADQDHLSDLDNLINSGISVQHLISNTQVAPGTLRILKETSGPLTADAEAYLRMRSGFGYGVGIPFDQAMGGITVRAFHNTFPAFMNTNDLSCVFFIRYGPFKIMFPGDIEKAGWRALLQRSDFRAELQTTTIYVASHHGRESGFCPDAFEHWKPQAVVISDKSIVHDTQDVDHRPIVSGDGIAITNQSGRRHVLTTRRDGDILFRVQPNGQYHVTTNFVG
jgi:beta-lactamase superfamily II metal-dependent hydrolase